MCPLFNQKNNSAPRGGKVTKKVLYFLWISRPLGADLKSRLFMAKMNKTPDVSLDASRKTILKNSLQESRKISLGHLPFKTFLIDSLGGVGVGWGKEAVAVRETQKCRKSGRFRQSLRIKRALEGFDGRDRLRRSRIGGGCRRLLDLDGWQSG